MELIIKGTGIIRRKGKLKINLKRILKKRRVELQIEANGNFYKKNIKKRNSK